MLYQHIALLLIAPEGSLGSATVVLAPAPPAASQDAFSNPTAASYMERLRALTARPGTGSMTTALPSSVNPLAALPVAPPLSDAVLMEPQLPEVKSDLAVLQRRENTLPAPSTSIDALKARLARMQKKNETAA